MAAAVQTLSHETTRLNLNEHLLQTEGRAAVPLGRPRRPPGSRYSCILSHVLLIDLSLAATSYQGFAKFPPCCIKSWP